MNLTGSSLGEIEFVNCLIDFALFDRVSLKGVTFRNCQMRDADFSETSLDRVYFIECDLARSTFDRVRVTASDMRHCTMSGLRGLGQLRGVAMEWNDVIAHAELFAGELGIRIAADPDEDGD
jgi:uncharacterized protein YjbI with pentapeptide repeats